MKLPPYAEALGITMALTPEGPIATMAGGDDVIGRPGFVHGGAIAGLLEIAALVALRATLGDEDSVTRIKPVTITVDYRRGGRLVETHAIGTVTRLGTRIANVDAVAWQEDRARPIASARMNLLLDRA